MLLHPPQCPGCPRNKLQEAAWQEVRLALHIGEPTKGPICGRGVGGAEVGLQVRFGGAAYLQRFVLIPCAYSY
jgi:hypothetical protein